MNIQSIAQSDPKFDFVNYFAGHTKASGWFTDRFGNIKRHFCGDFFGSFEGDVFVLDETLYYLDGMIEKRQWRVSINPDGQFKAQSDSLVGDATGEIVGNTLRLDYVMRVAVAGDKEWVLSMNDWMIYQPDGSLHNQTYVSKWGFRIGVVTTQYTPHDGELLCHDSLELKKAV
ncbi:MAG: DUF3833 domain-containing protein [Granulosicoccus sp.]|nr:DUF3833 domain-containing protein [Granulosicoccus sp.]